MKKSLTLILTVALTLCGCASLRMTPEEKAAIEAKVHENLDNRSFVIEVDQMNPLRGGTKHVNNYSLKIDGDKLVSQLPYFGQAWNLPYGGGKGMNFESAIRDYIETVPKADRREITITTNNGEDTFVFVIDVFTNGSTSIKVRSRNREPIEYRGMMRTDPQSDK